MKVLKTAFELLIDGAVFGLLSGSIISLVEIVRIFFSSGLLWALKTIWIMPVWGMIIGGILAVPIVLFSLIFNQAKKPKCANSILFAVTSCCLLFVIVSNYIFKYHISSSIGSFVGILISVVFVALSFGLSILLIHLIRRILKVFGTRWKYVAFALAIVTLISLQVLGKVFPPTDTKTGIPYEESQSSTVKDHPNILFIMIDALRYDCVSLYDSEINTPNIQKLGEDGIYFTNSFNNCSWTKPSVISMITALYPTQHNVRIYKNTINPELVTLPEVLREMGYYTIGFQNNPHLGISSNFHRGFNYFESFHQSLDPRLPKFMMSVTHKRIIRSILTLFRAFEIPEVRNYKSADEITNIALESIKANSDKRFFMYLHYMDPHKPYFRHPFNGEHDTPPPPNIGNRKDLPQDIIDIYLNTYKGEVEYTDEALGRLFDYLKESGLYNNTLIVLTSDHGDEFYEHESWNHGHSLFNELLRSVLVFKLPESQNAGGADSIFAQSIDIAPTIVTAVRGICPETWQGIDLLSGEQAEWGFALSGISNINGKAIMNSHEKLYVKTDFDGVIKETYYFNLDNDPKEQNNLVNIPEFKDRITQLSDELVRLEALYSTNAVQSIDIELDDETSKQLKALGYLQ